VIIAGCCIDEDGLAQHLEATPDPIIGFTVKKTFSCVPAAELAHKQPVHIPVDRNHDGQHIGAVRHLERCARGIWAIAEVNDDVELIGRAFSASVVRARGGDPWIIDSLSLTDQPAMIGCHPVAIIGREHPDAAGMARLRARGHHLLVGLLERAAARRPREPLTLDGQPVHEREHALLLRSDAGGAGIDGVTWRNGEPIPVYSRPGLRPPPAHLR
jgi:hypothetical protein